MTLKVCFEPYDRYSSLGCCTATITRDTLRECLNVLLDKVSLGLDPFGPRLQKATDAEVLKAIDNVNGDGWDFISYLVDVDTGKAYIEFSECVEEVW